MIEGKPLDKGTYGLHMIPNADEWTIIFSKNSTSWGSFTYDEKEDALRVTVKPKAADMHNALTYDFDDLQKDSAVVELEWEKVAVPFKVVGRCARRGGSQPEETAPQPFAIHVDELGRRGQLPARRKRSTTTMRLPMPIKASRMKTATTTEMTKSKSWRHSIARTRPATAQKRRRWNLPTRCRSIYLRGSCRAKSATKRPSPSSARMRRNIPTCGSCIPDWRGCTARRASLTMPTKEMKLSLASGSRRPEELFGWVGTAGSRFW